MINRSRTITIALWLWMTAIPAASADNLGGDPARGGELFRTKCFACHSLDVDRVGPRLGGVVGRPAGRASGYAYSSALASAGIVWDEQSLDQWLAGPREFLPGSRMPFTLRNAPDRRDLIAYLATLTAKQ